MSHLGHTHLFIEPFVVATHRNLVPNHPLNRLLVPHFEGTLSINNAAQGVLIKPGRGVDQLLGGTIDSDRLAAVKGLRGLPFNEAMPPKQFTARGVDDPDLLPEYPYRDDVLTYWDAIHDWVESYLRIYYPSDSDVRDDPELGAWIRDIGAHGGGRVVGIDDTILDFEYLVDAASLILHTSSVQHAAVNFQEYDVMSYCPNMPLALYAPAPTSKEGLTEQDYVDMLPPKTAAITQQAIMYLLGSIHYTTLGKYPRRHFRDQRVAEPLKAFRTRLQMIGDKISSRTGVKGNPTRPCCPALFRKASIFDNLFLYSSSCVGSQYPSTAVGLPQARLKERHRQDKGRRPMRPNAFDHLKVRAIIWTRYMNFAAIERWSKRTFRHRRELTSPAPALETSRDHYETPIIPAALSVPGEIPGESKLRLPYMLPYYYFTGLIFRLHQRFPIRAGIPWSPKAKYNKAFPENKEGWRKVYEDREFAQLRLQGPNPFLLHYVADDDRYVVDYSPFFKNIFDPVVCVFKLDSEQLMPESITIGEQRIAPGDDGWERAKVVANALDARYCVFTRHLLDTHLLIGEAYAISAFSLPPKHPLRPFLDVFTYGTLVVNDFAYKLLITPASYFIQSEFTSPAHAMTLFQNSMDAFSLNDLIVPDYVAKRGIDKLPNHPYVEDAPEVWTCFKDFVSNYVGGLFADDAAVQNDAQLQGWYSKLASLLPNRDITDDPLDSLDTLSNVLSCLLYNNVSHEVCGDFSSFGESDDPEHKKFVNFQRLKDGDTTSPPEMADVFLLDQGAFAGRFNVGGNNMMTVPVDKLVDDPGLRRAVSAFQGELRTLDAKFKQRNEARKIPFLRMMPNKWEISISF